MTTYGANSIGRADTPEREQAARVQADATRQYATIRGRSDLSGVGKASHIAAVHLATKARLADLEQSEKDHRASDLHDAETALYERSSRPATGADAISQRDAADRAAAVATPSKAQALLGQARRNNDVHLASAVAQRAVDNGWRDVINSYVGDDADKRQALDTITDHQNRVGAPGDKITSGMYFRSGTPDELRGMSPAKVKTLAEQAPTTE